MFDHIVQLSIQSGGLIPLMGVLLLITIAVIVERLVFYRRALRSGHAMEHDLQLVEYQSVEKLEQLASITTARCSARSSPRRWPRAGRMPTPWSATSTRRSCGRCPRSTATCGCSTARSRWRR